MEDYKFTFIFCGKSSEIQSCMAVFSKIFCNFASQYLYAEAR